METQPICKRCSKPFERRKWPSNGNIFCSRECRIRFNNSKAYKDHERARGYNLKFHFGITLSDYKRMFDEQRGLCAICNNPETGHNGRWGKQTLQLAVDHNPQTGKVRKLLCRRCNQGIGKFDEDPALLEAAAAYLRNQE
jgi:hypothetical protein